jgi:hypothetical protein
MYDLAGMPSHRKSLAVPTFVARTAMGMSLATQLASAVREFIAPRYRPELHYMRGPGPACARRAIKVESRRVQPAGCQQRHDTAWHRYLGGSQ